MKVEEELGEVCIWMRKTEAGLDGLGKGQTQELKFVLELERGRKHECGTNPEEEGQTTLYSWE